MGRAAFERAKIMPKLDSHDLHQKKGLEAQSGYRIDYDRRI